MNTDSIKETYSWFAIMVWCAYGIFALFAHRIHGILPFIVFFSVGIFIASFASIATYLLQQVIVWLFVRIRASATLTVLTSYFLLLIDVIWILYVSMLFLNFDNQLLSQFF